MFKKNLHLIILIFLSTVIIFIFFGKIIVNCNSYYFVEYGDGIQTYHEYLYHILHDDTFIFSKSMQYPYGENGYFSVNPLMLANFVKVVDFIIPVKEYSLAIFNIFVIFSLLIASICIYFIFLRLNISKNYALLFSLCITFMSPQILRFGGHNSLGYVFGIPLVLLSMLSTWENPKYFKSLLIGILVFFLSGNHLYYLGFFILIISLYYFLQIILYNKSQKVSIKKRFVHYSIELLIPLLVTQLLINNIHIVNDRTSYPWSFFAGMGSLSGLLYPELSNYSKWFDYFIDKNNITWESKAYLGIIGFLGFFFILGLLVKKILNDKLKAIYFNDNRNIVVFTIIGFVGLLIGIGYPFYTSWGKELFEHIGPIKQFRAIARFVWIFYYTINVISFYYLYQWLIRDKLKSLKLVTIVVILIVYTIDIYSYNKDYAKLYSNRIAILEDKNNELTENAWLNKININEFQAIIGIPFFHLGSENLYMGDGKGMRNVMLYSLKTGLPSLDVHSNRTPLQETFNTAQLIYEPYRPYLDFDRFTSKKDFIIIKSKDQEALDFEKLLIKHSQLIDSNGNRLIYRLPFGYFENAQNIYNDDILNKIETNQAIELSKSRAVFKNFDSNTSDVAYMSSGALVHPCQHYLTIYEDTLPNVNELKYKLSFWVGNIHTDVILRGSFIIALRDKFGRVYEYREMNLGKRVVLIDGDWALIEDEFVLNNVDDIVKITLINTEIKDKYNIVDNLLIKPVKENVYFRNNYFFYNNRFLLYN